MKASGHDIYLRGLLGMILGSICLLGLCACDDDPEGPYEDSEVQQTFDRYWPEYEFAVAQCMAHPALRVIGSKSYVDGTPEEQHKYADLNADDSSALNEVQATLDKLGVNAVYCERDTKAPGRPLGSVSFIYRYSSRDSRQYTHRVAFYTFDDAKEIANAASVKATLIPLSKPHWYLSPEKWNFYPGEQ